MQYADAQRWNAVCSSVGFSFANSRTVLLMVLHKHTHNVCWNMWVCVCTRFYACAPGCNLMGEPRSSVSFAWEIHADVEGFALARALTTRINSAKREALCALVSMRSMHHFWRKLYNLVKLIFLEKGPAIYLSSLLVRLIVVVVKCAWVYYNTLFQQLLKQNICDQWNFSNRSPEWY